jgi:hypothetical protein
MTPENFNLQIQTPEGEEGNDEISKLKAEMMSYKPLIEDAVKRQNLKEAEELFAKAKELKARLDELRNIKKMTFLDFEGLGIDHPHFYIFQNQMLNFLKTEDSKWFYKRFNGQIDEKGYLYDTEGKITPVLPSQNTSNNELMKRVAESAIKVILKLK